MKKLLRISALALGVFAFGLAPSAFGANATWTGGSIVDGGWATGANWSPSAAPGSATGVNTNADTATFNAAIANTWGNSSANPIVIDGNRSIKFISFDTSVGNYFIGSTGGNSLKLNNNSVVSLLSTVTGTNVTETINAPIIFQGAAAGFTNARADVGSSLVFGGTITNTATNTLTLSGAGTGSNLISGAINDGVGVQTLTITTTAGTWTLGGTSNYSGLTSITGSGGTTVFQGANISAGATTLNGASAVMQFDSATNGGLATGILTLSQGKIEALTIGRTVSSNVVLTSASATTLTVQGAQNLTFNGSFTNSGGNRFLTVNSTATTTLAGGVYLSENATVGRTMTIAGTGNTTISGTIADYNGSGVAGNLTVTSTGITTVSGANNTFTGTIANTSAGGTLRLTSAGSIASASGITLNAGSILDLRGDSGTNFAKNLASNAAAGTVTINVDQAVGGSGTNGTHTIGNISNLGTANSAVNLNITGGNGYGLSAGAVTFTNTTALTTSTITNNATGLLTLASVTATPASGSRVLVFDASAGNISVSGAVTGAGGVLSVTKNGSGTLTWSGTNAYAGNTTINAGALQFAKTASLYSGNETNWTATKIKVASGGTLALNVGGTNEFSTGNVTTLLTNLGGSNGTSTTGFAAGSTIAFDTTNASGSTFTVANVIANSTGSGGGAIGVSKLGANTLVLTGNNTYSGGTTVSVGTLLVNNTAGSGTGTGSLSVSLGATLGGNGTIGGAATINGNLSPGNSPGTLTFSSGLTLASSANTTMEITGISGGQFDSVVVTGLLTFDGTLSLNNTGYTAVLGNSVDLFDWTTKSGSFSAITGRDLGGGKSWDTSALYTTGVITVVPEPATWALLAFSLTTVIILRRRRSA